MYVWVEDDEKLGLVVMDLDPEIDCETCAGNGETGRRCVSVKISPEQESAIHAQKDNFPLPASHFGIEVSRAKRLWLANKTDADAVQCPDGGTCHHACSSVKSCFRVRYCLPLPGVFPEDQWPAELVLGGVGSHGMFDISKMINDILDRAASTTGCPNTSHIRVTYTRESGWTTRITIRDRENQSPLNVENSPRKSANIGESILDAMRRAADLVRINNCTWTEQ